jgi:transposase InsO family protein
MIDFTRLGGVVRPAFVGAVIDAFSRRVLAIGFVWGEPDSRFAVHLLRRALARHGAPTWLVSDSDRALRNRLVTGLLRRHGVRRRYGAVGRKGSIAVIERFWRSLKQEYVRGLFLYRPKAAIDRRLRLTGWLTQLWSSEELAKLGHHGRSPLAAESGQEAAGVGRTLTVKPRFLTSDFGKREAGVSGGPYARARLGLLHQDLQKPPASRAVGFQGDV